MGLFSSSRTTNTTETVVQVEASPVIDIDIDRLAQSAEDSADAIAATVENVSASIAEGLKNGAATLGFAGFAVILSMFILRGR